MLEKDYVKKLTLAQQLVRQVFADMPIRNLRGEPTLDAGQNEWIRELLRDADRNLDQALGRG